MDLRAPRLVANRSRVWCRIVAVAAFVAAVPVIAVPSSPVGADTLGASLDGVAGEQLGTSVDRDGATHIVGGVRVARIVERTASGWSTPIELTVPGGNPVSFGNPVSIDMADDGQFGLAVVGAAGDSTVATEAGSAHVFEFTPATGWSHVERVDGDEVRERVGNSVGVQLLADDRTANVLVGAPNQEAVGYIASWLRRNGTSTGTEIVTSLTGDGDRDRFGISLAVDGDTMVVGAFLDDDTGTTSARTGSASVFSADMAGALAGSDTMSWVETHHLSLCDAVPSGGTHSNCGASTGEYFGSSVAVRNDVIAVGAPLRSAAGGGDAGSVTVFERDGVDWVRGPHLQHEDAGGTDRLGTRVAVGDRLIVASAMLRGDSAGSVHTFYFDGVAWDEYEEIVRAGDGTAGARFGSSLSLDGTAITAGSPLNDFAGTDAGDIWEYVTSVPPADYPPIARPDAFDTFPSDTSALTVLDNDDDPEGEELFVSDVPVPAEHGTVEIIAGGSAVSYTPDAEFAGTDVFTYEASDGRRTATAEVTVTVRPEIRIDDIEVDESVGLAELTVTATPPLDSGATFDVIVTPDTATTPDDYTVGLTSYAIEPGASTATVTIDIVDDDDPEPTETFTVQLDGLDGIEAVDDTATVTITDTDTEPSDPGGELGPPFDPPGSDEPTGGEIEGWIDEIFDWLRRNLGDITDRLPNRPEFGEFVFENWPPALPEWPSFEWGDICPWLAEHFEVISCEIPGIFRDPPLAVPDELTMQQGTTRIINVARNDRDDAGRPIFVVRSTLPTEDTPLTGLDAVEVDSVGNATITASADYVGGTSFVYRICTVDDRCANGTVNIEVVADPPPPQPQPDEITLRVGEERPDPPTGRPGINVLADDIGDDLRLMWVNQPEAPRQPVDTGNVVFGWNQGTGDVSLRSTLWDPPQPGQFDNATNVVPYKVCDPLDQCAESTLTVLYTGRGPNLEDDFVNYGIRRRTRDLVTDNDSGPVRIVAIRPGVGADVSLDPDRPPTFTDDGIVEFHTSAHPEPGFTLIYTACNVFDGVVSDEYCGEATITAKFLDREGPTANDDEFDVPVRGHLGQFDLDVIGAGGGGPDITNDRPVGFQIPGPARPVFLSYTDLGDPDDPSDDTEIEFAEVRGVDPLQGSADDNTSARLYLVPATTRDPETGADILAPLPPTDTPITFQYRICDLDLDAALEAAENNESPSLDGELCDTATVTLTFVADTEPAVDQVRTQIGLAPGAVDGTWVSPITGAVLPQLNGELRYLYSDVAVDTASDLAFSAEVIPTPANDPITSRPNPAEVVGSIEVPIDLELQVTDPRVLFPTEPIPLGSDSYYRTEICDDSGLCGSGVSTINYSPYDFGSVAAVRKAALFDEVIDLTGHWWSTPTGEYVPEPVITVTTVNGEAAIGDDGDLWDTNFGPYRVEVRRSGSEDGPIDEIRIIPDVGFVGLVLVPYEACATWDPQVIDEIIRNPNARAHEACRSSFVVFDVDASVQGEGLVRGRRAAGDDTPSDTLVEFTIEERLADLFSNVTDTASQLGTDAFAELADLFDSAGVDIDGVAQADAIVRVTAGVDDEGPYIDGSTSIVVDASVAGSFTTVQTFGGIDASASGTATVQGDLSVQLGEPGERFHLADVPTGLGDIEPRVDYDLLAAAQLDLAAGIVTASPHAVARIRPSVLAPGTANIEASAVIPVEVEIPGSDDDTGAPIVVELEGRLEGGVLRITGGTDVPPGALLDGFGVRDVVLDLTVDTDGTNGTINAEVEIPALADALGGGVAKRIPVRIDIAGSTITGTTTADLSGLAIGPDQDPYLTIDTGSVVATATGDVLTGDFDAQLALSAATVSLLPGNAVGSATLTGVTGTLTTDGPQILDFTSLTAGTADFTAISTGAGTITIGGPADEPVLVLTDVDALDSGTVSVRLGRVEFYADGRVIVSSGCLAADVGLAEAIGLGGILPFDVTSACLDGDLVTVEGFFDFSMMDDFPFTPTVTIGSQTVDASSDPSLEANRFRFTVDATTLVPTDLGPIRIGIDDFAVGGLSADGYIEIAGYGPTGFDGTFTGQVDVTATGAVDELPIGGEIDIDLGGTVVIDDDAGVGTLQLFADVAARGFLGEYVELTAGDARIVAELTVPADLSPGSDPVAGSARLESADLAGVVRVPGLESSDASGGVPVTLTFDGDELVVTAGGGATYATGPLSFDAVTGTLRVAAQAGTTTATGVLTIGELSGSVGDVVDFEADDVELTFDALTNTPLLSTGTISASIADPADADADPLVELTIASLEVSDAGALSIGVIEATNLDRLADRFGFGQLLPFTITGLRIDPSDLSGITTTVAGRFDFDELESLLPGDDVNVSVSLGADDPSCNDLGITGGGLDTFCFTVALDALGPVGAGSIEPVDFGPLTIDITGLDVAGVEGSLDFAIVGYDEGEFIGDFSGSVDVATDLGGQLSGDFGADFSGALVVDPAGGASLSIAGTVDASLVTDGGSGALTATFRLGVAADANGDLSITGPVIDDVDASVCIEVPGVVSRRTGEPDCAGVFARVVKNGSIWTATVGGEDGLDVTSSGLSIVGLAGVLTVDTTNPNAPVVTGSLDAERVTGLVGGVVELSAEPVTLNFDTDPETPIFGPTTFTGRLFDGSGTTDDDVLVTVQIVDFVIASDGTVGIAEIRATDLDQAAAAIGIADILPLVLSGLSVTFDGDDITSPDAVTIRAAGAFDLSVIADLGPVVQIGDGSSNGNCDGLGLDPDVVPDYGGTFCVALAIDENGVRPVEFGPITLGLTDVAVGPFTFGGTLQLGGYVDGAYVPVPEELGVPGGTADVRGTLSATVQVDGASAEADLVVSGDFSTDAEGRTVLVLDGELSGGFNIDDTIVLEGATVTFDLGLRLDTRDGFVLDVLDANAHSLSADLIRVGVPGVFTVEAKNPSFPLDEGVLLRIPAIVDGGGIGLYFGDAGDDRSDIESSTNPLDGWGGTIGGFEVDLDGSLHLLDDFEVRIKVGDGGFPEYLPISFDEIGMRFGGQSASDLVAGLGDNERKPLTDVIDQIILRGSMSISGTSDLPVDGSVDGLEIDIGLFRAWFAALAADEAPGKFFITNLDGLFFGIDDLKVGPVRVSGGLGIGVVNTATGPEFWARILGGFVFQGYGLGIDVLVSEYGPLSVDVTVPGAMVLGQTGIVVAVTDAGATINSAPPEICTTVIDGVFDCDDGNDDTIDPVPPVEAAEFKPSAGHNTDKKIADAIELIAETFDPQNPASLLPDSFGVFIKGQVSHLAIASFVQGELELGLYFETPSSPTELPGVKLVGRGDATFFGMSLANIVLYADYGDPLAPAWTVAGGVANGGDLLDLFFPIGAAQAMTLDTEGLAAATILGIRELVLGLLEGTLESPAMEALFAEPLDALIVSMQENPGSRTRQVLFGDVADDAITVAALRQRILDVLPGPAVVDRDGKSEIALLLENAEKDGGAALEQVTLAIDVAGALFADLLDSVIAGEAVPGPGDELVPPSEAQVIAKGEQMIAAFQEFLSNAPDLVREAGQVVYDVANPALVAQGKIQFELLDVPIGEPALDSTLVINKEGVFAQFDGSIAKLTAAAATFVNAAGAVLIPLSFLVTDQTNFGLSFPFRFDDLLAGEGPEVFDPRNGEWSLSTGSEFYLAGMEVSSVDGIIVPGDSERQVADWELASERAVPQVGGPDDATATRDRLVADGGLFVAGELSIPEALADPLGWIDDVDTILSNIPDDILELPGYIGDAGETLLATRPGGDVEIFAPMPEYDSALGLPNNPAAWSWPPGPYLTAEMGVDLLGYRVANGSLQLSDAGVFAGIEFPFLDGPLQARLESVVLAGQEKLEQQVENGEAQLSELVRWPTVEVDQTITKSDVDALLNGLGLDTTVLDGVSNDAELQIRGYSPHHHLTADDPDQVAIDDPIRVSGGFEITVAGSINGIVDDGDLRITVGFGQPSGNLLEAIVPSYVQASVGAESIDLGGIALTDVDLTATYDADASPKVDLIVGGTLAIGALDQSVRVDGSLAAGVLTASATSPIQIGDLTVAAIDSPTTKDGEPTVGPTVTLRRASGGNFQVELEGVVTIRGWSGSATVDTVLGTAGSGIDVALDDFGRSGVELDGTVSLDIAPGEFTLELVGGSLSVDALGIINVSVGGRITESGIESLSVSDIEVDLGAGARLRCADIDFSLTNRGFSLSGTAGVTVAGVEKLGAPGFPGFPGVPGGGPFLAGPGLANADAPNPGGCEHDGFSVSIDLESTGFGSVELLGAPTMQIHGVNVDVTSASVTRKQSGTRLEAAGSVSVLGTSMPTNGTMSLVVSSAGVTGEVALFGALPSLFGWGLSGSMRLDVSPDQTRFGFSGTIRPSFSKFELTVGSGAWIGIGTNPAFSLDVTADQLTFSGNPFQIDGDLSIYRAGGAMTLSISDGSLAVPGFGDVGVSSPGLVFNNITVSGDGALDIDDFVIEQIGTDELRLVNAKLDFTRTANGTVNFRLHGGSITGTVLNGNSFPLGTINISHTAATNDGFSRTWTVPGLDLGVGLSTSPFSATITVSDDEIEIDQGSSATASVLGSSVSLRDVLFRYRKSNGTVTASGELEGKVTVLGRELASTKMSISRDASHLKLDLDASASVSLGVLDGLPFTSGLSVDGWLRSDGHFELTGSWSGSVAGVAEANGTMTMRVNNAGPSFRFSGSASVTGVGEGTATGTVNADNVLIVTMSYTEPFTGNKRYHTFWLPPGPPPASTPAQAPPVFDEIENDEVPVTADLDDPSAIPVYFLNVIDLNAPGADTISCSPPNGSLFEVGKTTRVTCTASNEGGFGYVTFDVIVDREPMTYSWFVPVGPIFGTTTGGDEPTTQTPIRRSSTGKPVVEAGRKTTVTGTADRGTTGKLVMHSDPIELGTFVADADGNWSLTFELPTDVDMGDHTIVVDRVVDGKRRLDHVAVVVEEAQATPVGELPATGNGGGFTPRVAVAVLLAGIVLWLLARRRNVAM